MSDELHQTWAKVRFHLDRAWALLPAPGGDDSGLGSYSEYLDANELELAADAIATVGEERRAGESFWLELASAAALMHLTEMGWRFRAKATRYPCPCCGYLVHADQPGTYEFCPLCGWQDDVSQLRFPSMAGGANELSLLDAQRRMTPRRDSGDGRWERDPEWRTLELDRDQIEVPIGGRDYGTSYAADRTEYYYWRRRRNPAAE